MTQIKKNNLQYIFRKIKKSDDLNRIMELIIKADPYTYIGLFGSKENAYKILPFLISDSSSIFYRENYYCCEYNREIIGICSLFLHEVQWNKLVLLKAFALANVDFPDTFTQAYDSFSREFNEEFNVGATTCQVSVKEEFRNKGVATFILENIFKMYEAPIQLYVNENNKVAIKLYEKFGFKIIGEYEDYAGLNQPTIKVYKMYKG